MAFEKMGEQRDIISHEDIDDPHLKDVDLQNVSPTDIDFYLQMVNIRKGVEESGDILSYRDRIENLGSLISRATPAVKNNDEKNFLGMIANKLQNLSLQLQKEAYIRKKSRKTEN